MPHIHVSLPRYASIFGGAGFHNNEAMLMPVIEKEHFNQVLCKCYREIAPGFMRTFGGYDDWTKEAMDSFADYYEQMQKVTDTPIYLAAAKGKVHFSEEAMREYADNVAKNLAYLYHEKGVRHLRYYCFSNEMSRGGWGDLMHDLPLFKQYHELLFAAFQKYNLPVGLLATDASEYENWKTVDWAMENMPLITEDYCVHIYEREHDLHDLSWYGFFYDKCAEIVSKAIRGDGKRVILGEFGIQKGTTGHLTFNGGVVIDVNRYFEDEAECAYSALMLTEMCFAAINAGMFALAYWSYTDYPDPYSCAYSNNGGYAEKWGRAERFISGTTDVKYNKWGLLRWDENGDHTARAPYWCLAWICKLFKKNAKVLALASDDDLLRMSGVRTREGCTTVGIVNRHTNPTDITLDAALFDGKPVRVYEYDPQNVPFNRFADLQAPSATLDTHGETVTYTMPPESVIFITSDYIEKNEPVEAENVRREDGFLLWDAVNDPNHCYYRVYLDGEQIASTVATSLPAESDGTYRVLSVDISGNI